MKANNWVWMPHAGHCIIGDHCRFHLNTYVGNYIVSTIGEYWPERTTRECHAQVYDPKWLEENKHLKGDTFDMVYMNHFGYEEIGCARTYETMVFKAMKSEHKCCPYTMRTPEDIDFKGYNKPEDALKGHIKMCRKWSKK